MDARMQALPFNPASLLGLSEKLLQSHHQNNYGGAVKRLNAIRAQLAATPAAALSGFALNGLKREELIATNSMLLHELYFGSVAAWRDEFVAMGRALGGGSGWVLLTFQPREGSLVNQWASDHGHALAGGVPILALDMYEHAYHLDHGAAAGAYVDACMANIDWAAVYARYQQAVHAASDAFAAGPEQVAGARLLDVRRAGVHAQATTCIPGAQWRDPAAVGQWGSELAAELPAGQRLVVYCVYGHEVGRATAMRLRAAGLDAHFLQGGIDGWASAGRPLANKGEPL